MFLRFAVLFSACAVAAAEGFDLPPAGGNLVAPISRPYEMSYWRVLAGNPLDILPGLPQCADHGEGDVIEFHAGPSREAITQEILLPPADAYDFSLYYTPCGKGAAGKIYISLEGFPLQEIDLQGSKGSARYFHTSFQRADFSGGEWTGHNSLTLRSSGALTADVAIQDVRLTPRDSGFTCNTDPSLLGDWRVYGNGWQFNADGTFTFTRSWEADPNTLSWETRTHSGTWCSDTSTVPHLLRLYEDFYERRVDFLSNQQYQRDLSHEFPYAIVGGQPLIDTSCGDAVKKGVPALIEPCLEVQAPPLGQNLVLDAGVDLAGCLWGNCGECETYSGRGAHIFRRADCCWDGLALQATLPEADYYELSFQLGGCGGRPRGYLLLADGTSSRQIIPIDESLPQQGFRRVTLDMPKPVFENAQWPVEFPLYFQQIYLEGGNVVLDDIRLIARNNAESDCALDPPLVGQWRRISCEEGRDIQWSFRNDGTFTMELRDLDADTRSASYDGIYCASGGQITLSVERRCSLASGAASVCLPVEQGWAGSYEVGEGILDLSLGDSAPASVHGPLQFGGGLHYVGENNCSPFEGEQTPEGEGAAEGEGGIEEAPYPWVGPVFVHTSCYEYGAEEIRIQFLDNEHARLSQSLELFQDYYQSTLTAELAYFANFRAAPREVTFVVTRSCLQTTEDGITTSSCGVESRAISVALELQDSDLRLSLADSEWFHLAQGLYLREDSSCVSDETPPSNWTSVVQDALNAFASADANDDLILTPSEAASAGVDEFELSEMDINADGLLSLQELQTQNNWGDSPYHSADTNADLVLDLRELLRVVQLYNAGAYRCAPGAQSEDGYLPGPWYWPEPPCTIHTSDYLDGDYYTIGLGELLRTIQIYNVGQYHRCTGSGDGICI